MLILLSFGYLAVESLFSLFEHWFVLPVQKVIVREFPAGIISAVKTVSTSFSLYIKTVVGLLSGVLLTQLHIFLAGRLRSSAKDLPAFSVEDSFNIGVVVVISAVIAIPLINTLPAIDTISGPVSALKSLTYLLPIIWLLVSFKHADSASLIQISASMRGYLRYIRSNYVSHLLTALIPFGILFGIISIVVILLDMVF